MKGKTAYTKFTNGEQLSAKQAIEANCYYCCGGYADGATDCGISACPLYGYHPYNPNKRKNTRSYTPEARERLIAHMQKIRK